MTALQPRWHHQQPACTTAASRVLLGPVPWPSQQAHHAQACLVSRSNSHSHSSHRLTSHRWRSATCCRAKSAAAAAAGAATSSSNHPLSLQGLLQLEPQMGFLAQTLCHGVLLPVLAGWLFVAVLSAVASRARQWCDDNPDEPLSLELLGLLPAALESPTRVAVALFVTTRVLRNVAAGLNEFVHIFKPRWDDWADAIAHGVVAWLGPFDATLVRLYTVVAVLAGARVLIKWKTIALEFVLHQRDGLAQDKLARIANKQRRNKGYAAATRSAGSASMQPPGNHSQQAAGTAAAGGSAAATAARTGPTASMYSADDNDDDCDEAAVVQRDGSMLSVSMRPRSAHLTSPAEAAPDSAPSGSKSSSSSGAIKAITTSATGGWGGASNTSDVPWSAPGTKPDDAVERLLLPLDSILSWAIAVMAGLLAVQTLGINIQPLLAVGGASSLIIGLATQTLLTNAVMGVSIFLSRPFVPGDSITVQAAGAILVSGVVERVTPMRTLLRTDDDVLVTLPNKTIADMIVYNKSRREARSRLITRSWERPFLKFKIKLPQKELQHLQDLQQDLRKVLKRPGVAQQSIEVALSKFTDAGAEVLLQCLLLVQVGSPTAQQLLLDLAFSVRKHGATLVSIL